MILFVGGGVVLNFYFGFSEISLIISAYQLHHGRISYFWLFLILSIIGATIRLAVNMSNHKDMLQARKEEMRNPTSAISELINSVVGSYHQTMRDKDEYTSH